ncbi:MAG: DNA-processing protein DprA [Lachnospiraceae bacterium]|nr:DNA-processing protein DprA [Lachnospiraceae bacterium]
MNTEEFAFASTRQFTRGKKRKLLEIFNDVREFLNASDKKVMSLGIVTEEELKAFQREAPSLKMQEAFRHFTEAGYKLAMNYDNDFPESLRYIHEPPVALFYNGTLPGRAEKLVAMVGARRCTAYGRVMATKIAFELASHGYSVVSGMAYGVDGHSHRGALEGGGMTYAFVASGIDICYPEANRDIYEKIPEHGAVISEFAPSTRPLPEFFPDRNRLISGLSQAVLVIEARERSGSLITADFALDQGKDVYALPGKVTDPLSAGCNKLIWQGAGIIRSTDSLIDELQIGTQSDSISLSEIKKPDLTQEELLVYSAFDFSAKSIDEVQGECGLTLLEILGAVSSLCQRGYLKEVFLNHYVRNNA